MQLDIEKVTGNTHDMRTQGFTYWTTNLNGETKNYWTTQQYYISPGKHYLLLAFMIVSLQSRKNDRVLNRLVVGKSKERS